jgi:hypothetical protein
VQFAAYDRGTVNPPTTQTYMRYAAAVASKRQTVVVGQQIVLDALSANPVRFNVVAVNGNGSGGSLTENDRCVDLVLHFGSFDAEFGGDLSGNIEGVIVSSVGQVELYKVHHHGSATSSSAPFLTAVHPKIATLSMSATNGFGHPTATALANTHATGAITYWTTAGKGAPAVPPLDVVVNGTIVVDVPAPGSTFSVIHNGVSDGYPSWPPPCSFSLTPTSAVFFPDGGTSTVTVSAPAGCSWSATSNANWLQIFSGGTGTGDGIVTYMVSANPTTNERVGTLTIAGMTFTITQKGQIPCSYGVVPTSGVFSAEGGSANVGVSARSDCPWSTSTAATWIHIINGSGTGQGGMSYTVDVNATAIQRAGTLTIGPLTFSVTQTQSGTFTTEPLVPGVTLIRSAHIIELRSRINTLRVRFGLGAYPYTDGTLGAGSAFIKAVHILDLRAALNEVYGAASRTPPTYTDPTLGPGTRMKVAHIAELRAAVVAIE